MAEGETESLLVRLRRETAALHEALDATVGARLVTSRDDYATFLRASLAAAGPVESAIARVLGGEFAPARAERIRADLLELGDERGEGEAVPFALADRAEALGAAYVIEGSALGGSVLAGKVRDAFGEATPRTYLALRGPGTGARWKWFLGELAAFDRDADEPARAAAIAAASRAFTRYREVFARAFA